MTLKDIYLELKVVQSPAQKFISDIAALTCREESTVKQWIYGAQIPPRRAKIQIAAFLNKSVSDIWPEDDDTQF